MSGLGQKQTLTNWCGEKRELLKLYMREDFIVDGSRFSDTRPGPTSSRAHELRMILHRARLIARVITGCSLISA
jgi:hypothetical protein